ncbi:hypothetical protein [Peribacillus frigoritolerans]|uniref:hypothetical protein n=1 Tax=Peribacillus frigoritolerans TaxID=450367 RepID=UPI002E1BABA3|nr:hypothetical protein [Peribacillus frigoritolerans]MED3849632.1 hypothetical protein [Peribacillus frigoritolerans]WVN13144.1 hypothetical protein V2I71_11380 [Peribacillus frigoritolerans]
MKHWFQKANETDGILDVSSEQVKLQVNIIDLTEYDLKLINILERQSNPRSRELLMPFIELSHRGGQLNMVMDLRLFRMRSGNLLDRQKVDS